MYEDAYLEMAYEDRTYSPDYDPQVSNYEYLGDDMDYYYGSEMDYYYGDEMDCIEDFDTVNVLEELEEC